MGLFGPSFKVSKIKPYLKMSMTRIGMMRAKMTNDIKKKKREVADLLKEGKEEKARIRAEAIIRQDFIIEAMDIIELDCSFVLERIRLLETEKECPFDMLEHVATLIYAWNRTDIKELKDVKEQLLAKYGKDFVRACSNNTNDAVNSKVILRLSAQPPNAFLVINYMKIIAKDFQVDWEPSQDTQEAGTRFDAPMVGPRGGEVVSGGGSGLNEPYNFTDGTLHSNPPNMVDTNTSSAAAKLQDFSSSNDPSSAPYFPMANDADFLQSQALPPMAPLHDPSSLNDADGGGGGGGGSNSSSSGNSNDGPGGGISSSAANSANLTLSNDESSATDSGAVPNFEELTARFAALKKGS